MNFLVRKIHKYLSFFISVQLLLWTISGIYFAFNKIELVRGALYLKKTEGSYDLSIFDFKIDKASDIDFQKRLGKEIIIINSNDSVRYLDKFGMPVKKMSSIEAMESVINQTSLTPLIAEEVLNEKAGSEFRGRSLPIYRVKTKSKDDSKINVYINMYSGNVVAIRSDKWRIWDLMWGLHIMDWKERDNIDNLFLKIFSILALVSSLTGIMLFFKLDFKKSSI